ncbi:hypothetical protein KBB41_03620 [Candidatus Curtissbacteria bacterium]|nr:hypothetical protein [Candidatus Curtissbacteria bacterium]
MHNKPHTLKARKKMSEAHKGTKKPWTTQRNKEAVGCKNGMYKGDKAGYRAKHIWAQNKLGKANQCKDCGLDKIPEGKKRYFQWANISREYKLDIEDWKQLCIPCHKKFDKKI